MQIALMELCLRIHRDEPPSEGIGFGAVVLVGIVSGRVRLGVAPTRDSQAGDHPYERGSK
jgi:hypothetical protein